MPDISDGLVLTFCLAGEQYRGGRPPCDKGASQSERFLSFRTACVSIDAPVIPSSGGVVPTCSVQASTMSNLRVCGIEIALLPHSSDRA